MSCELKLQNKEMSSVYIGLGNLLKLFSLFLLW